MVLFFSGSAHSISKSSVFVLRRRVAGDKWHIFTLTGALECGQGVCVCVGSLETAYLS